jgi:peptidoglycan/xylan/chitin deacetylase (PgdA/CDA1 family)
MFTKAPISRHSESIFSVDLEDWFFMADNSFYVDNSERMNYLSNYIENVTTIIDLLDEHNVKATFFVLGAAAREVPSLVQEIKMKGHEIASHGYSHRRVSEMTEDEFKFDLCESVEAILKACGVRPYGFRAPQFSISGDSLWAF